MPSSTGPTGAPAAGPTAALVHRFYDELWNRADEPVAEQILTADFRFRGSLGAEKTGRAGFLDYLRGVHAALADYRCEVLELVEDGPRAAARMHFSGRHRGPLLGVPGTGRKVAWEGAAFFTAFDDRLATLWVLGDLDGLRRQLGEG